MSPEKAAGSVEMAFGVWGAVGPSNHVLGGGSDSPMARSNFGRFLPRRIALQMEHSLPLFAR